MLITTRPSSPGEARLLDILNAGHRKYPPEHYAVVLDEFLCEESGNAGVFRVFTYRDTLRFAALFDGPPGGDGTAHIAEVVKERMAAAGQQQALMWISLRRGPGPGLPEGLSIIGEPFHFLEMSMDRRSIAEETDLGGMEKRLFAEGDDEACIELLERAYTPALDPPGTFRQDRERLMGVFRNRRRSRAELFLAGGELVGLYGHNDGDMEFICVDPRHQGKGRGGIILRCALAAIKADSENEPRLTAAAFNNRAISLYRKVGFETVCRSVRATIVSPES